MGQSESKAVSPEMSSANFEGGGEDPGEYRRSISALSDASSADWSNASFYSAAASFAASTTSKDSYHTANSTFATQSLATINSTMAQEIFIRYSPAPHMERFDDIMKEQAGGHDTWITEEPLYLDTDIPAIPPAYAKEEAEGRAIYIRGVPAIWQNEAFRALVSGFGRVEKCPILISLGSEHTFRWVIMATAEGAQTVLNAMHYMQFQGNRLTTSMATKPGRTLHLVRSLDSAPTKEQPVSSSTRGTEASTVHGHPSPTPTAEIAEKINKNVAVVAARSPSPVTKTNTVAIPVAIPKEFTASSSTVALTAPAVPSTTAKPAPFGRTTTPSAAATPATPAAPATEAPATSSTDSSIPATTSWASIASAANPSTSVVDLHPENRPSSAGHRLQPIGRIPTVVRTEIESQAEKMRVVFLLNLPNNVTLQDISNGVKEGPLVRIQFGYDEDAKARFSGVVFQYAKDAAVFHSVLQKEKLESRPQRFRFVIDSVRGDAFAADETLRAMSDPNINATRRLTMVKKGFFFAYPLRSLTALCYKVVGEEKVQLVWLYNGGNATVVFSDVAAAIKMKAELDRLTTTAVSGSRWAGLQTTYSKDPCQVPLELKSAITT
jgi:hypothetical protein